jgi:hypothetical protein
MVLRYNMLVQIFILLMVAKGMARFHGGGPEHGHGKIDERLHGLLTCARSGTRSGPSCWPLVGSNAVVLQAS